MQGHAPEGYQFEDVEEEYMVDAAGRGSWQPLQARLALLLPVSAYLGCAVCRRFPLVPCVAAW